MRTWADIAVLVKTKGLNGGFVAKAATDLPFLLQEGMHVAFVPPTLEGPREADVESISEVDRDTAVVFFSCEMTPEQATNLVGSHVLVKRASIEDALAAVPSAAWEGWAVSDADAGFSGKVVGFIDNPGQALLEVEAVQPSELQGETVLIPVVDEIICDVDAQAQHIDVILPKGLLEL